MNRRLATLTVATVALTVFGFAREQAATPTAAAPAPQVAVPAAAAAVPQHQTRAVQLVLKSYGYTIVVDGIYGPQTTKVVQSWQRSNGLLEDGVAGPITQRSLGLDASSTPTTSGSTTPVAPRSSGSVEQMIRDIWPDDLEEKALRIAWRESNWRPDVTSPTGCCHGVFQIHWPVHRGWLDDHGVTSVDQLFDAETNIRMAWELYQRSNGWGPWSATA